MFVIAWAALEDTEPLSGRLDSRWHELCSDFCAGRRRAFLGGRVLLQMLLKELGLADALPYMALMRGGKPFFPSAEAYFNISHSAGTVCVALSDRHRTGIDLEYLKPRHDLPGLMKRVQSEAEREYFAALEEPAQLKMFTAFWTVRESLLKDSGLGLYGLKRLRLKPVSKEIFSADNEPGLAVCFRADSLTGRPGFFSYVSRGETPSGMRLEGGRLVPAWLPDTEDDREVIRLTIRGGLGSGSSYSVP